jgi:hypothetical protein
MNKVRRVPLRVSARLAHSQTHKNRRKVALYLLQILKYSSQLQVAI